MTLETQRSETPGMREGETFDPQSLAVVTTTFYRNWQRPELRSGEIRADNVRGDLAIQTLGSALSRGFQTAVVDGGSSPEFVDALSQVGIGVSVEVEEGLSGSRRQGFREAVVLKGVKIICWTEPEKRSVTEDCLPNATLPILHEEADIVIPKRNSAAFETYPPNQVCLEKRANRLWNNLLRKHGLLKGEDLDVLFGPRIIRNDPELVELFQRRYEYSKKPESLTRANRLYDPELWPNATFLPIVNALRSGYRVVSVPVDYRHPPTQTSSEIDNDAFEQKRALQYHNIVTATIHLIRSLEDSPGSKLRLS